MTGLYGATVSGAGEFVCSAANDHGPLPDKVQPTGCLFLYREECDLLEAEAPMLVRQLRASDVHPSMGLTFAHGDRELMPRGDAKAFEEVIADGRAWGVFRHRKNTRIYDLISVVWTVSHITPDGDVIIFIENLVVAPDFRGMQVAHIASAAAVSRAVMLDESDVRHVCATVMSSNTRSLHTQTAAGVVLASPEAAGELAPRLKPILEECEAQHRAGFAKRQLLCAEYQVGFVPQNTLRSFARIMVAAAAGGHCHNGQKYKLEIPDDDKISTLFAMRDIGLGMGLKKQVDIICCIRCNVLSRADEAPRCSCYAPRIA